MSVGPFVNWGEPDRGLVVLDAHQTLGKADTFWLYGVISIGALVFCFSWCRKPKEKALNRLKRTGRPESIHEHYEGVAEQIIRRSSVTRLPNAPCERPGCCQCQEATVGDSTAVCVKCGSHFVNE